MATANSSSDTAKTTTAQSDSTDTSKQQYVAGTTITQEAYDSIEYTRQQLLTSSFNEEEIIMIEILTIDGQMYTRKQLKQMFADFKKKGLF